MRTELGYLRWPFLSHGSVPNCGMSLQAGHGVPFHVLVLLLPLLLLVMIVVVLVVVVVARGMV